MLAGTRKVRSIVEKKRRRGPKIADTEKKSQGRGPYLYFAGTMHLLGAGFCATKGALIEVTRKLGGSKKVWGGNWGTEGQL